MTKRQPGTGHNSSPQARHAGLLTVLGQPISPSVYLIKSA
jgi:hypothetical protein